MQNFGTVASGQQVTSELTFTPTLDSGELSGQEQCIVALTASPGISESTELVIPVTRPNTGDCLVGKLYGSNSGINTLANMKNWTNGDLAISFTNLDHSIIDSVRIHTTARTPSYYNGNGGTFKVHLMTDNGSGKPSGVIVASTDHYIGATISSPASGNPWGNSRAAAESAYPNAIYTSYNNNWGNLQDYLSVEADVVEVC